MAELTIIGGGVAGLCAARALRDRGADVRVIEAGGSPGPHACSWWAGGMLAPDCEGETAEEPVVRLGREAAEWWQQKTGLVHQKGSLVVSPARDRSELSRFARRTAGHQTLDGGAIAALEPDLAGRFSAGLFFADEAHLSPRAALDALYDGLVRDGVEFETAVADPLDFATRGMTLDCRGYRARERQSDLRGVRGEMVVLRLPDITLSRPVRLLHPRFPLYIVPRGDGVFMLGATMIETAAASEITARAMIELLNAAYGLHPAFAEAEVLEIGVDTRPAYPDNLPRIRRSGNLISINGLFRHGFLLAPAMARMAAEMIFDGARPEVQDDLST